LYTVVGFFGSFLVLGESTSPLHVLPKGPRPDFRASGFAEPLTLLAVLVLIDGNYFAVGENREEGGRDAT